MESEEGKLDEDREGSIEDDREESGGKFEDGERERKFESGERRDGDKRERTVEGSDEVGREEGDDSEEIGEEEMGESVNVDGNRTDGKEEGDGISMDLGQDRDPRVAKYDRFKKIRQSEYERVNEFLRKRTYITAREWAIARLCSDFRTETGVEMTLIGENLPELVPFMTDTYTPQAVNQARSSFVEKVKKSGATFLYGSMSDFFTTEELDEMMYEVTETARFLLEVEGAEISVSQEKEAEDRISKAMREMRESSKKLREEENGKKEESGETESGGGPTEHTCPECGHSFEE